MLISEKITIDASSDDVWTHLQTLQDAEQYIPVVTKSKVNGSGLGTTRTCDVQMGEQSFQLMETLVKLDDPGKSLTIAIDDAPPSMKGLLVDFSIQGNNPSELQVSTQSDQTPENVKMIQGVLSMICNGLKEFHEK